MSTTQTVSMGHIHFSSRIFYCAVEYDRFHSFVRSCLARHRVCDWGDIGPDDAALNDHALVHGDRLLSAYQVPTEHEVDDSRIWIITEADRFCTMVLFPAEY